MIPVRRHPSIDKILADFVDTLDLLSGPLFEDSMLAIVIAMKPGHLMIQAELLEKNLHLLEERDMVNILKFFTNLFIARKDAGKFLTDGLIAKISQQIEHAEGRIKPDVTSAAITLLSMMGTLRFHSGVISFKRNLDRAYSSDLQTLAAMTMRNHQELFPHFLDILPKLKSSEFSTDSRNKRVHQHLKIPFHNILQKYPCDQDTEKWFAACMKILRETLDPNILMPTVEDHPYTSTCDHKPEQNSVDFKKHREELSLYVQDIVTEKEHLEKMIYYLIPVLRSPIRTANIKTTVFFSELLCHPGLLSRNLASYLLNIMMVKTRSSDTGECSAAVEALGNATEGAPEQVATVVNCICEDLIRRSAGNQEPTVVSEILRTFGKLIRYSMKVKLGDNIHKIIKFCLHHLNCNNPATQIQAGSLFAALAQSSDKKIRAALDTHVITSLSPLFIKLHSEETTVAAAGVVGLHHLLPCIGCRHMQPLLGGHSREAKRANLRSLYKALAQEHPKLLKTMMFDSMLFIETMKEKEAVLKHLEMIREAICYKNLSPLDQKKLFKMLLELLDHRNPLIVEAANSAIELLKKKWKCLATVKTCIRSSTIKEPPSGWTFFIVRETSV